MGTFFLLVLLALATVDLLFGNGVTIAPVALLYVAARMQANWAAARFLQYGLYGQNEPLPADWVPPSAQEEEPLNGHIPKSAKPETYDPRPKAKVLPFRAQNGAQRGAGARAGHSGSGFKKTRNEDEEKTQQVPRPKVPPREEAIPRAAARPSAAAPSSYQPPRFSGRPNEVLGVNELAPTGVIHSAFRHWVKQFHPDKQQSAKVADQNDKVRRLHSARATMLERRKQLRKNVA